MISSHKKYDGTYTLLLARPDEPRIQIPGLTSVRDVLAIARPLAKAYGEAAVHMHEAGENWVRPLFDSMGNREVRSMAVLEVYGQEDPGSDDETRVVDLLTDLCHLWGGTKRLTKAMGMALDHYAAEVEEQDDEDLMEELLAEEEEEHGIPASPPAGWYAVGGQEDIDVVREVSFRDYLVEWRIDVCAASPEAAAMEAKRIQEDPESSATVFHVTAEEGNETVVDVSLESHGRLSWIAASLQDALTEVSAAVRGDRSDLREAETCARHAALSLATLRRNETLPAVALRSRILDAHRNAVRDQHTDTDVTWELLWEAFRSLGGTDAELSRAEEEAAAARVEGPG